MKNGFTLIELIFTIVILAITTMAIPRMVAQTAELNILAIQQELVENAKTATVQVLKAPWDGAYTEGGLCSSDPDNCADPTPIHTIPSSTAVRVPTDELDRTLGVIGSRNAEIRKGFFSDRNATPKSRFRNKDDNANALSHGEYAFNDLDDYHISYTRTIGPTPIAGNTQGDFILNTRVQVGISYLVEPVADYVSSNVINANLGFAAGDRVADASNNTTNIKLVEVNATDMLSNSPARSTILRYYAFNIGARMINHRDW